MNFTATLIGAVIGMYFTHNLIGALVGGALGFMFDASRQQQRRRTPAQGGYIAPLFALIGAVAKADGRVSEAEIAIAERLMARMGLETLMAQKPKSEQKSVKPVRQFDKRAK